MISTKRDGCVLFCVIRLGPSSIAVLEVCIMPKVGFIRANAVCFRWIVDRAIDKLVRKVRG